MASRLRAIALIGAVATTALLSAAPAHADWHSFWGRVRKDFHRVNSWPAPWEYVDRDATRAPFAIMVAKGWQRQHTLGSSYFDPETHQLTPAGQEKVQAILQTAPPEQRTIFVSRGRDPHEAQIRMDSVQQIVAQSNTEQPANVLHTSLEPEGWSAAYINAIETKMRTSIPNPRLPRMGAVGGAAR
jgi:hypothetical protein